MTSDHVVALASGILVGGMVTFWVILLVQEAIELRRLQRELREVNRQWAEAFEEWLKGEE